MSLRATPFHARAVDANRLNVWENRAGFTLAAYYSSVAEEAVAARFGAVIADITWHWRVVFSGKQVETFVARAFTRNASLLPLGAALEVLWLNDAGAVRGLGTLLRIGADQFLLSSIREDAEWLQAAAGLYDVTMQERARGGVLALIGPTSGKILKAAGLTAELPPWTWCPLVWRGLDIGLSRLGLGFEIWCDTDSALIVWDRLMEAGRSFALLPAGQSALDILDFESGHFRPGRDFAPARDGFAPEPTPQALGLSALVDRGHFFNGRAGVLAAGADISLAGLLVDSEAPLDPGVLVYEGRPAGRLLKSRFSPALERTAAFAILNEPWPSAKLVLGGVICRPVGLPFLAVPFATETAGFRV